MLRKYKEELGADVLVLHFDGIHAREIWTLAIVRSCRDLFQRGDETVPIVFPILSGTDLN